MESQSSAMKSPDPVAATDSAPADVSELLTAKEAARFLNVPVSWIYEHVRPASRDRLPSVKLGKYLRFDDRDLRAYVDAKRADSVCSRRR